MTLNEFKEKIYVISPTITHITVTDCRYKNDWYVYNKDYTVQQFFDITFPDSFLMDEGKILFIHQDMLQIYIRIEDAEV